MLATTLLNRVVRNIDFWRGNYRDKDMPRYDLSIAIFDTIHRAITTGFYGSNDPINSVKALKEEKSLMVIMDMLYVTPG